MFLLYGPYHKVIKNISALIEIKTVTKLKTVQLCRKVNLVMPDVLCTPLLRTRVLLRAVSRGILNTSIRCAQVPFWHCSCGMLERGDVQQFGHHSEMDCHALYMPLEFLPGSKEEK